MLLRGEPVVEVLRGPLVESVHEVAACAVDGDGKVLFSLGTIDVPVYLRSTAKPFIAATAVQHGVVERFGLDAREIAVMAASHSGEPFHVDAVRSILKKIGLKESALKCGPHAPYNAEAAKDLQRRGMQPGAVHNNCSGKHAGILALCKVLGADPETYLEASNPAEQEILTFCARLSDESVDSLPIGVDGCGIPVYATPLRNAALSFARLATLRGIDERDARALGVVRSAMMAYPEYVSGTKEFDAELMRSDSDNIVCKGGAEGVHGSAVIDRGIGLVTKVVDGTSRARGPAVVESLFQLGVLSERQRTNLAEFAHPIVYNRSGRTVGSIRAAFENFAVEKASLSTIE
ncbi:MAG: asparaginase [Candidatus Eremiobacteraeota bacterium]|nr:asparaginase [Candidatus Eremiobacteraeota bacterium]